MVKRFLWYTATSSKYVNGNHCLLVAGWGAKKHFHEKSKVVKVCIVTCSAICRIHTLYAVDYVHLCHHRKCVQYFITRMLLDCHHGKCVDNHNTRDVKVPKR